WGDLNKKDGAKPAASTAGATPAPTATPASTSPSPTASATTVPASATPASTTPATTSTATPATGTPSESAPKDGAAKDATTASTSTPASTTAPTGTTPSPTPSASTPTPAPAVATTTPVKAPTPAKVAPIQPPAEQPWYQNQTVLLGGGGALLLVGLLALMRFMRKPKPVVEMVDGDVAMLDAEHAATSDEEEHRLLEELAADPGNTAVSLELLRLYYARGDVARFETTAEAMHANVTDLSSTEWQEALAMGAVLAPHNPLFSGAAAGDFGHEHVHDHSHGFEQTHDDTLFGVHHDEPAATLDDFAHTTKPSAAVAHDDFDFDLPETHAPTPAPAHEDLSFDLPATPAPAPVAARPVAVPVPAPAPAPKSEEFFVGEDAIGTKLDLAKAYMDMGDPEGARSMLDEVLTEGNDTQKGEARRLLAEIR
ncbi:MAG TPA: FimV/HubP family polar landmark protein, partial [Rudaea sp.]